MANVNVGAILLTGFVVIGGAMIGGISRMLNGGSFVEIAGGPGFPWFRTGNKKQKRKWSLSRESLNTNLYKIQSIFQDGDDDENVVQNQWWKIMDQIDGALLKYDLDLKACSQRAICWHVKDSLANVEDNKASSIDHIINGLTR